METLQICSPDRLQSSTVNYTILKFHISSYTTYSVFTICEKNIHNSILLQNVGDAGARKLKAEIDPEGPDHNESSGDS